MDEVNNTKERAASIAKTLGFRSAFHNAPEMILEQILELQKILVNFKTKNGENETYKKFTEILNSMRFSFNFMNDIAYLSIENNNMRYEVSMLKELLRFKDAELSSYKSIEAAMLDGTLNTKIDTLKVKNKND